MAPRALILAGGYGTRLRPLTLSVPKPLIDFCNKSIVEHQIEALAQAGVKHISLAVACNADALKDGLHRLEEKFGVRITCSLEDEPLGTAGPIRLAKDYLIDPENPEQPFFVCNSDVICNFPFRAMLEFHQQHAGEATILVTRVEKPENFGVVLSDPVTNRVEKFFEKPKEFVGNEINGGIYILSPRAIDRIELKPTSIEREIFPKIAEDGKLFKINLEGFWADIGQPADFLSGQATYLEQLFAAQELLSKRTTGGESEKEKKKEFTIFEPVLIHPTAHVGHKSVIGPNVTVGENCRVGSGVRLQNCALMAEVQVDDFTSVAGSILGWNSKIGKWVRIDGLTVIGKDVRVKDEVYINQSIILPNKIVQDSIYTPGQIIL